MVSGRSLRASAGALMLDSARFQWEEGRRRIEAEGTATARARELALLVEAVVDELPRRVGSTFTLTDLARVYARAEDWVRDVVAAATPARSRAGIRDAAVVQDAAFARYARGAVDYRPE